MFVRVIMLLWLCASVAGASTLADKYPFLNLAANRIEQAETLDSVFAMLTKIEKTHRGTISIAQFGDSHVQGGYASAYLRSALQRKYGDAGRGLVFGIPYTKRKLRGRRGNSKFEQFQANGLLRTDFVINEPVSGINIVSASPRRPLSSITLNSATSATPSAFTELEILLDAARLQPVVADPNGEYERLSIPLQKPATLPGRSVRYVLRQPTTNAKLYLVRLDSLPEPPSWQGAIFYSGKSGILYHAVGLNGATFGNYCNAEPLYKALPALDPALIILSLGTNDSYGRVFDEDEFRSNLQSVVRQFRAALPHAKLLLTTPPDALWMRRSTLSATERAAQIIRVYSATNGIASWDFHTAMGGIGSMKAWHKAGLGGRDYVHLTKEGYELQAEMLYEALMQEVDRYAHSR